MKSLLLGALIAIGLGCAGYDVRDTSATEVAPSGECEVTVSCLPDGTCRIEGNGPDGEHCWAILRCDPEGSCEVLESGGEGCDPDGCQALEDCAQLSECTAEIREACAATACDEG